MLKDLEQRSPESNKNSVQSGHVVEAHSPAKIAMVTGVCVLMICLISFYIWQLIGENKALKAQQITNSASVVEAILEKNKTEVIKSLPISAKQESSNDNNALKARVNSKINNVEYKQKGALVNESSSGVRTEKNDAKNVLSNKSPERVTPILPAKSLVNNSDNKITPVKKAEMIVDTHSHSADSSNHSHEVVAAAKPETQSKANKMSVSRRQLSADELADQKLALVEKALAVKQVEKAEKLLEDVVIIRPNDSQTRKKLAALWFGRQAYQDAVNLLSQGISLNDKDSSLRQMKARIHLKQGQYTAALNTLKPLAQLKDEQYQVMLANTAQQAKQDEIAVNAYKVLIAMKPDMGRWQLGLAVLYDKNSRFKLASKAYKKALTKNDLSVSSENFIKQRIQVIGQ
jgi:MSHA biogenesis protein MshN